MTGAPLTPEQLTAADWLTSNWDSAMVGAALTIQLRERFGIQRAEAFKVIGEARRRLGK
jgi:hypothetical protein